MICQQFTTTFSLRYIFGFSGINPKFLYKEADEGEEFNSKWCRLYPFEFPINLHH